MFYRTWFIENYTTLSTDHSILYVPFAILLTLAVLELELLIGLKPQSIDQCFTKQREDRIICSRVRFLAVLVLLFTRRKASPYR